MAINYLSLTGLVQYDSLIKAFIEEKVSDGVANSFKYVNLVGDELRFYTINPISEDAVADFVVKLPETDVSNLMQLVENAVNGNIAIFGDGGQVVDGGVALSALATKAQVEEVAADVEALDEFIGDIPTGYTETTIIGYINKKAEETLASASGGSTESAASVLAALNTYKAENDPKVAANTEGVATNAAAIAELKEDVDAFFKDADMTESAKDTLKELQEYIASDETGAAAMAASIKENSDAISTLQTDLDAAEEALGLKAAQSDLETEVAAREALAERVEAVEGKSHEHANKDVIDGITSENVASWDDAVTKAHVHENADVLDGITSEKVSAWDASEANSKAYTDEKIEAIDLSGIAENASAITTLSETHATDKASLQSGIDANAQAIEDLENSLVEITEEQINGLFPEE